MSYQESLVMCKGCCEEESCFQEGEIGYNENCKRCRENRKSFNWKIINEEMKKV